MVEWLRSKIHRYAFPFDQLVHAHRSLELLLWWFPVCLLMDVTCGWNEDCVGFANTRWYRFFRWVLGPEKPGTLIYMAPRLADDPEWAETYAAWKATQDGT